MIHLTPLRQPPPPPPLVDTPPVVVLKTISDITPTSSLIQGKVIAYGGSDRRVSSGGLVIGEQLEPTVGSNFVHIAIDSADFYKSDSLFKAVATNLAIKKLYHVRAYVKNKIGNYYSNDMTFITEDTVQPSISLTNISSVTHNSATVAGTVLNVGGYGRKISGGGILISDHTSPTVTDNLVKIVRDSASFYSSASFSGSTADLAASKTYYTRAYVTNQQGIVYSNELAFTTTTPPPPPVSNAKTYTIPKNQPVNLVLESGYYGRSYDASGIRNEHIQNLMTLPQGINMYLRVDSVYGNMVRYMSEPNLAQVGDLYLVPSGSYGAFNGITTPTYQTWRVKFSILLIGTTPDLTYYCNYERNYGYQSSNQMWYKFETPAQYGTCNTQ